MKTYGHLNNKWWLLLSIPPPPGETATSTVQEAGWAPQGPGLDMTEKNYISCSC
jgi:hypothetical protein